MLVGHAGQRRELQAELVLGRRHLVVVLLDLGSPSCAIAASISRAHVLRRVLRRHREVALLGADAVAEIAALVVGVGVGRQFDRVELEAGVVGVGAVACTSSNMKNSASGPKKIGVADAHRLDHALGLLGDAARIAVVGLAGGRLEHVADQHQRGLGEERIDAGGRRIRHQAHVELVDRLPAGDRGAVEHLAFGERVLVDHGDVEGDVLPLAARIGETEVDVFHVVVLDHLQDIFGRRHGMLPFR